MRRGSPSIVLACTALVASLGPFACRRKAEMHADPVTIGPEPAPVASDAPSATPADAAPETGPPHVVALPVCTKSARVAWTKSPFAGIACAPTRKAIEPSTITIAKGTPVRLHLRAEDTTKKGAFKGTYRVEGMPPGAKLDPTSGEFSWTATASATPIELGFAAILPSDGGLGECVTDAITIKVVDDAETLANLYRWNHYILLRDADLDSTPSDAWIDSTGYDGESDQQALLHNIERKKAARATRQKYLDDLLCGLLPGGAMEERDVDADGNADVVFSLLEGDHSFVITRTKGSETVVGKILGSVASQTVDGRSLFVHHFEAENAGETTISWLDGGAVHQLELYGERSADVEWDYGPTGVQGVALVHGGVRDEYAWTGTAFTKK